MWKRSLASLVFEMAVAILAATFLSLHTGARPGRAAGTH